MFRLNRICFAKIALAALVVLPAALFAQTAQLTGIVFDSSQARIPGARIEITNQTTAATRVTVANQEGTYTLALLPPGTYQLKVEASGFRSITQNNIVLEVEQSARLDLILQLGATSDSVLVTDTMPLLQAGNASLGQVIESKQFQDMPLNDRSALGLISLSDAVITSRNFDPNSYSGANVFSAGGSRAGQNEMLLDGAPNTMPGVWPGRGILGVSLQVDAVQEVKVQTSSFSAEFGRTSGGLVNMVSRSGSNAWHASAFEYLRNSRLDANDFFNNANGVALGAFRRNQFGGTLGGPVRIPRVYDGRNRTFFFMNYQGTLASTQAGRIVTTPNAAIRQGDFSAYTTPAGQKVQIYDPLTTTTVGATPTRTLFPNNIIPASRIDPASARIVSFFPAQNLNSVVNNLIQSGASRAATHLAGFRVDHALGDRQRFFVRYSKNREEPQTARWLDSPAQGFAGQFNGVNAIAGDYSLVLSPSTILGLRYGFTGRAGDQLDPALGFDLTSIGMPAAVAKEAKLKVFPSVTTAGYLSLGNAMAQNSFNYRTHSWQASLTSQRGSHTLKTGVDLRLLFVDQRRGIDPSGTYNFTRAFTQGPNANTSGTNLGDGIASLLLGTPASGTFGTAVNAISWNQYVAGYLQDDWKISPRLTVNLGLRYDLELPRYEVKNTLDWFDFNAVSPLSSKVSSLGTLHGGLQFAGVNGNPRRQFDTDKNSFAPRVGFAFQLDPRTVIRGGMGIFYGSGSIGAGGFNIASQGFAPSTTFVGSLDGLRPITRLSNPFPDGFAQPVGSADGLLSNVGQSIARLYDRSARLPYNVQSSFSVQRQLRGFIFQGAYAANKGTHLSDGAGFQINQLPPSILAQGSTLQQLVPNPFFGIVTNPGILRSAQVTRGQLLRPYPQFDALTIFNPAASSSIYHSGTFKVERRFARGLGLLASYTFSKNISDAPATVGPAVNHQDFYNRRADRSVVEEDVPHRAVASANYALPLLPRNRILGGWQVNAIWQAQSGFPLAPTNSPNTTNSLGGGQRPNATGISANKPGNVQSKLNAYLNAAAFSAPAAFTFGNAGRTLSNVRGPRLTNVDMSLFKTFRLTEAVNLQFRTEVFNLSNSPMFAPPNMAFGTAAFGTITSQLNNPRQIQMALRLGF
jgi:hypothetical protein